MVINYYLLQVIPQHIEPQAPYIVRASLISQNLPQAQFKNLLVWQRNHSLAPLLSRYCLVPSMPRYCLVPSLQDILYPVAPIAYTSIESPKVEVSVNIPSVLCGLSGSIH